MSMRYVPAGDDHQRRDEFLRWAYGDLTSNTIRGALAEWHVGRACGLSGIDRVDTWNPYDLLLDDDIRIEVKTTGTVVSWDQAGMTPSKPAFGLLSKQVRDDPSVPLAAHAWVFAVQLAEHRDDYRPFDTEQWTFYVVPGRTVRQWNAGSIQLAVLQTRVPEPTPYDQLESAIRNAATR